MRNLKTLEIFAVALSFIALGVLSAPLVSAQTQGATPESFSTVTTPGTGRVLGVENFLFMNNLRIGMRGTEVVELQKRLRTEGFFTLPIDTGYFGPVTLESVIAYQRAHLSFLGSGYLTGFVGPFTRGVLNGWINFNWEA